MGLLMKEARVFGDAASENAFVQLVDGHDLARMEREAESVRALSGRSDWSIRAVPISDWDQDLTPWAADPVFGARQFGDGASRTLRELLETIPRDCRCCLCGYSLAGLFALWAGYQTDAFTGIVAASPSAWYPNWIPFAESHAIQAPAVYLSLGDREERAKNPILASVGGAIRRQHALLASGGIETTLEWNPGNHFMDSELRVAKGIAWMLKSMDGRETCG